MGIIIGEAPWFVKKRNLAELWICGKDVILWLSMITILWYDMRESNEQCVDRDKESA